MVCVWQFGFMALAWDKRFSSFSIMVVRPLIIYCCDVFWFNLLLHD